MTQSAGGFSFVAAYAPDCTRRIPAKLSRHKRTIEADEFAGGRRSVDDNWRATQPF
jgi:hypothetical protein